ncbi:PTS system sorbose-specific EIIB component [bacterium HR33]|nr:PTS system sorbose-specific EIIB component [bacterium HR33]
MSLELVRVDDRYIHGQVVVGWGRALGADTILLVDDAVSRSPWEQELYRIGVPPEIQLEFTSVAEASQRLAYLANSSKRAIVLLGDVHTLERLCCSAPVIRRVNIGGLHQAPGRKERLPYVFLSDEEALVLRRLRDSGIEVVAQDLPTARAVPVDELL